MFTVLLLVVVCCLTAYLLLRDLSRPKNYPPGPRGVPVLGNTPRLRNLAKSLEGQHKAFSQLAQEFKTPVLGLKLGNQLVVVALTPTVVREVLTKDEYIGRPDSFFMRLRCFGARRGITFADGEFWHEQRSFTLRTLRELGMGKPRMEALIQEQVQQLINQFHDLGKIEPIEILSPCIIRVLWEVVAGQRLAPNDPQLLRLIHILNLRNRAFDMAGGLLNQFPWIRHIAPNWSGYQLLTSLNAEMKKFLLESVEEHRISYKATETRDLIDAFLHELNGPKTKGHSFTEDQLLMVLVDLFLGGASSTSATLNFAFLFMLVYPDVQEKVFDEIYSVVGLDRMPTTADRLSLPYTEAVLLEVQRFSTVIPITGPRRVLKDTTLDGFHLPKDTTVLISQWSVHRDGTLYPEPDQFRPERFLDPLTKINRLDHLIPFGLGKRRCLGESLAKPCLFLIFAGIVQTFQLKLADNEPVPSLDPIPGIILTPRRYHAVFKQRLKLNENIPLVV